MVSVIGFFPPFFDKVFFIVLSFFFIFLTHATLHFSLARINQKQDECRVYED